MTAVAVAPAPFASKRCAFCGEPTRVTARISTSGDDALVECAAHGINNGIPLSGPTWDLGKAQRRAYATTLTALGIKPAQIVYSDDRALDYAVLAGDADRAELLSDAHRDGRIVLYRDPRTPTTIAAALVADYPSEI